MSATIDGVVRELIDGVVRELLGYAGVPEDEFHVRRQQISALVSKEEDPAKRRALMAECAIMGHVYGSSLRVLNRTPLEYHKSCIVCTYEETV